MSPARWVLPIAAPFALALGCGREEGTTPVGLTAVAPSRAYNDATIALALIGGPFRPTLEIETSSGESEVGGTPFAVFLDPAAGGATPGRITASWSRWRSSQEIDARVDTGVPTGTYDVVLRDPRGQTLRLPAAFTSLGPDLDTPALSIPEPTPGAAVAPGMVVPVAVTADDGPGHLQELRWTITSPTLGALTGAYRPDDPPNHLDRTFTFVAPDAPGVLEPIQIQVEAEDSARNVASASLQIVVAAVPTLDWVLPAGGPTSGQTRIVVGGAGFVPGLSQIFIDGVAIPGDPTMSDTGELVYGVTPPHLPGFAALTVATGSSRSAPLPFTFSSPPVLRSVDPTSGPEAAATVVTLAGDHFRAGLTQIFVVQGDLRQAVDATFVSANRIVATIPPGVGVISIVAFDPVSGESELVDAFSHAPAIP